MAKKNTESTTALMEATNELLRVLGTMPEGKKRNSYIRRVTTIKADLEADARREAVMATVPKSKSA